MSEKPKRKRAPDTRPPYYQRSGKVQKVLRMDADELATIEAAAKVAGVSASQFVIQAANKAAVKILKAAK